MENKKPSMIVLGSTGSVGEQAIDVANRFGVEVDAVAAHKNAKRVEEQARAFKVKACAMSDEDSAKDLKERLADTDIKVYSGTEGICEMIAETDGKSENGQVVENSILGEAGLMPTLATLRAGKRLALANKESLVVGGDIVMQAAKESGNERLFLLLQTICATGIRVSELVYITAEAVRTGTAHICCKGKYRDVFLPSALCKMLKAYLKKKNIKSGPVFVTRNGRPLDRSNIWSEMKRLCEKAGISAQKVFPHNLRHLFARTYYKIHKDVVRLADILGHSHINTTRIYTMENGEIHRKQIQKLGLLRC